MLHVNPYIRWESLGSFLRELISPPSYIARNIKDFVDERSEVLVASSFPVRKYKGRCLVIFATRVSYADSDERPTLVDTMAEFPVSAELLEAPLREQLQGGKGLYNCIIEYDPAEDRAYLRSFDEHTNSPSAEFSGPLPELCSAFT